MLLASTVNCQVARVAGCFGAIAAAWLVATTARAPAATLTRLFSGTITSVGSAATALGIAVGDPITGSFTWDATTLSSGSPFLGGLFAYQKASPIAPNSLNVTIGSFVVPALAGEGFGVYVGNDVPPPVVASKMDLVAISRAIGFGSEVPGQVSGGRLRRQRSGASVGHCAAHRSSDGQL